MAALHLTDYVTQVLKWLSDQSLYPKLSLEFGLSRLVFATSQLTITIAFTTSDQASLSTTPSSCSMVVPSNSLLRQAVIA